jgi:hypothetical protein
MTLARILFWFGAAVGVVAFVVFSIGKGMADEGTPRTDRRFKTGYKNNAIPDHALIARGGSWMAIGGLIALVSVGSCLVSWKVYEPEREQAPVADMTIVRDMTVADVIYDLATAHKKHRKRTHVESAAEQKAETAPSTERKVLDPYE